MTITGSLSWLAVKSSELFMRNDPSPSIAATTLDGRASFAPIAAGNANPIVEYPPELRKGLGWYEIQSCDIISWGSPALTVTIASRGRALRMILIALGIPIGVAALRDSISASHASFSSFTVVK